MLLCSSKYPPLRTVSFSRSQVFALSNGSRDKELVGNVRMETLVGWDLINQYSLRNTVRRQIRDDPNVVPASWYCVSTGAEASLSGPDCVTSRPIASSWHPLFTRQSALIITRPWKQIFQSSTVALQSYVQQDKNNLCAYLIQVRFKWITSADKQPQRSRTAERPRGRCTCTSLLSNRLGICCAASPENSPWECDIN